MGEHPNLLFGDDLGSDEVEYVVDASVGELGNGSDGVEPRRAAADDASAKTLSTLLNCDRYEIVACRRSGVPGRFGFRSSSIVSRYRAGRTRSRASQQRASTPTADATPAWCVGPSAVNDRTVIPPIRGRHCKVRNSTDCGFRLAVPVWAAAAYREFVG